MNIKSQMNHLGPFFSLTAAYMISMFYFYSEIGWSIIEYILFLLPYFILFLIPTARFAASQGTRQIINSDFYQDNLQTNYSGLNFGINFVSSTFIQGTLESALNYNPKASVENLNTTDASSLNDIDQSKLDKYEKGKLKGGAYNMPDPEFNIADGNIHKVSIDGEVIGYSRYGTYNGFIRHGATVPLSGGLDKFSGYQTVTDRLWPFKGKYFLSGSSHQDAARILGSRISPAQLFGPNWTVIATTGLFGSYGGNNQLYYWLYFNSTLKR